MVGEASQSNVISSGEKATIQIEIKSNTDSKDVNVGIIIRDKFGQDIFGTNLFYHKKTFNIEKGKKYICEFIQKMNLGVGKYTLTCAMHVGETHTNHCIHWIDKELDLEVVSHLGSLSIGLCKLYPEIRVQ